MRHLLLAILAVLIIPTIGCKGQSVITPEQAMGAVRAYEGDTTLQLICDPLESDTEGSEWWYDLYDAVMPAVNKTAHWTVNAVTSEITDVVYYQANDVEWSETSPGPLTKEECRQIAENYARSKYSGFDTMGFQLHREEWQGRGWYFCWCQRVAYGAWTPNSTAVGVNGVDGRIQSYWCVRDQTPTPPQPQITEQQAVNIVRAATGIGTEYEFTERNEPELEANLDSIWWGFIMTGEDAQGQYLDCAASVDAVTGEILYLKCDTGGGFSHTSTPSVTVGDPISIRDLTAKVPGAKVHWLGKDGARVFVGKNRYTLVPGRDTVEWTGGTIKLSAKMKLVNGRLMVPSGLLDVLKSPPEAKKAPPARTR